MEPHELMRQNMDLLYENNKLKNEKKQTDREIQELRDERDELKNELEKIKLERDEEKRQIEINKLGGLKLCYRD